MKKLEEHAKRQNRFTAMGEMAANIAHEIRNPLGSIELFASLVKKDLPGDDEKVVLLDHISSAIASMNHIISNVLEYTKPRPVAPVPLNLAAVLKEVVAFSSYLAENNGIQVDFQTSKRKCWIRGDEERLKQVFQNLMLNAFQSMTDGGGLAISMEARTLEDPQSIRRFSSDTVAGVPASLDVVEVGLTDSGCGLPQDIQSRIFDPFFSTKSRGTGLGLAIVHSIVAAHQAMIDVESQEGQGTTFTLTFPALKQ